MSTITHFVGQSLDGYIEGPNGEFDWPVMDEELSAYARTVSDRADVFLYGRVVWEVMSSYWPRAEEMSDHPHDLAFAPIWREKPKAVVSRTLGSAEWSTRVFASVDELAKAKDEEDKMFVLFGATSSPRTSPSAA